MEASAPGGLLRAFEELPDPRMNRTKHHSLKDILAIAICAVICGADGWTQVELFGNSKIKWFKTFLDLPKGFHGGIRHERVVGDYRYLPVRRDEAHVGDINEAIAAGVTLIDSAAATGVRRVNTQIRNIYNSVVIEVRREPAVRVDRPLAVRRVLVPLDEPAGSAGDAEDVIIRILHSPVEFFTNLHG